MPKIRILMELKLKRCKTVFKEGFKPGVIASQELEWDLEEPYSKGMVAMALNRQGDEFVKDHTELVLTELGEEDR